MRGPYKPVCRDCAIYFSITVIFRAESPPLEMETKKKWAGQIEKGFKSSFQTSNFRGGNGQLTLSGYLLYVEDEFLPIYIWIIFHTWSLIQLHTSLVFFGLGVTWSPGLGKQLNKTPSLILGVKPELVSHVFFFLGNVGIEANFVRGPIHRFSDFPGRSSYPS